jgi:hypothetical protein
MAAGCSQKSKSKPKKALIMATIHWPFGPADTIALSATGTQAISIANDVTIIDGVTTEATGNRTLNVTISAEVKAGALLLVRSKTNGTETTIFGTGIDGPTITGEAGKTYDALFVYTGSIFVQAGTAVKID